MRVNQLISKVLIIVSIHEIKGDCGLPAIPDLTKLSLFKSRYEENTVISYECEDPNSELIEGKHRQCVNHRWNGSLPRCGQSLNIL